MTRWKRSVSRWLAAERAADVQAAEQALASVFAALFDPAVSPAFAGSVLLRLEPRPFPLRLSAAGRWGIAAGMLIAALWVALLPGLVAGLPDVVRVGSLVEFTGLILVGASRALSSWLGLWQTLAEVSRVLLGIVSKPPIAATLVAGSVLSALLLRLLAGRVATTRSGNYA